MMAMQTSRRLPVILFAAALVVPCAVRMTASPATAWTAAQPGRDIWIAKAPKGNFQPLKDPNGLFTMEIPRRDWSIVPGAGVVVASVVNKKGDAAIVVEQAALKQALAPDDITDLFADLERELIVERQPKAADFQTRVLEDGGRKLVAVQFVRPGMTGMERVRQFSIPAGRRLYRVSCVASLGSYAANEIWFAHAVATFVTTATE